MNRKQLTLLLAVAALVAGAALLVYRGKIAGWKNAPDEAGNILAFEPIDVGEVDITGTGGAVLNLVDVNGAWTIRQRGNYPADLDRVAALIRTAWELKPTQTVVAGPSQLPRLELAAPGKDAGSGTLVEFKGSDGKSLASLLLGKKYYKKNPDPDLEMGGVPMGRYVMAADGKNRVFLVSETLDEFDPKPEKWLNHDFIKVENIQAIAFSGTAPVDAWQVARDSVSSTWKLLEPKPGEQINLIKTSALAGFFSNPSFDDVLAPDVKAAVTGLDKPVVLAMVTFDHFSYLLKIGKPVGDDYPVKIELNASIGTERPYGENENPADSGRLDEEFRSGQKKTQEKLKNEKKFENHIYLVPRSILDPVLLERSQILLPSTSPVAVPLPAAVKK